MKTENTKKAIRAERLYHRDGDQIALRFDYDTAIRDHLRKLEGIKWTQTHQCFYLAHTPKNISRLINHCRGVVWVDIRGLQVGIAHETKAPYPEVHDPGQAGVEKPLPGRIGEAAEDLIRRMAEKIQLKAYSPSTLKAYISQIRIFLGSIDQDRDPLQMTKDDIEQYLFRRYETHPSSESDRNMHINAIKFLYEQVLGKERMLFYLPRPEKPLQLPKVLGERELERVFRAVSNLKHKAILLTAFSCGLRVSEVVRLRLRDIDSERMQVHPVR